MLLDLSVARFFAATWTAARASATGSGRFGRSTSYGGSPLGFGGRGIRLEYGGLAFHVRLRLLLFLFDFRSGLRLGSRRLGRRIKLRAQIHHHHALFFMRFHAHYGLVLRVVEELAELLE